MCSTFYIDTNETSLVTRDVMDSNLSKANSNLLYIRNQFVPYSKHFSPRL
jgi:hypothetical protein